MRVVLPFKNRPNYLRLTLSTIKEAMRSRTDIKLHLFDDMSTTAYPLIIEEMDLMITKNSTLAGPYQATSRAINEEFLICEDEYLFALDADCIVHPNIFNIVENMVKDLPKMGFGTLFNTDTHKVKAGNRDAKGYVRKVSIGGLGCIIKRDAWEWYRKQTTQKGPKHKGWDWDFCYWLATTDQWHICSTINSYVDHMGQTGSHSGPSCEIDRAIRFLE